MNAGNTGKATPFYIACQEEHHEVVSLLLANMKINVNKPTNTGATPFCFACRQGHKEVVTLLLADMRIDVNKSMNDLATPFLIACANGQKEVVSLLLQEIRIDVNNQRKKESLLSTLPVRRARKKWCHCSWLT